MCLKYLAITVSKPLTLPIESNPETLPLSKINKLVNGVGVMILGLELNLISNNKKPYNFARFGALKSNLFSV